MDRALHDLASGLAGTFTGTATFTPNDDGTLSHCEHGSLAWAGSAPTPATRDLLWRPTGSGHSAEVFFPDGRFFHGLDLTSGEDSPVHPCAPDVYRGHFMLQGRDQWRYTWQVNGPHKDLRLVTHLTRVA